MSAPGCCRHCQDACSVWAVSAITVGSHSTASETVEWSDEHCPFCDERQRLDDLVTEYLRARRYGNDLIVEGIGQALDIIRGDEPGQPSQHTGEA